MTKDHFFSIVTFTPFTSPSQTSCSWGIAGEGQWQKESFTDIQTIHRNGKEKTVKFKMKDGSLSKKDGSLLEKDGDKKFERSESKFKRLHFDSERSNFDFKYSDLENK